MQGHKLRIDGAARVPGGAPTHLPQDRDTVPRVETKQQKQPALLMHAFVWVCGRYGRRLAYDANLMTRTIALLNSYVEISTTC